MMDLMDSAQLEKSGRFHCGSGRELGCPITERVAVQILLPPSQCPWARHKTLNSSQWGRQDLAKRQPPIEVWMGELEAITAGGLSWCEKVLNECSPLTNSATYWLFDMWSVALRLDNSISVNFQDWMATVSGFSISLEKGSFLLSSLFWNGIPLKFAKHPTWQYLTNVVGFFPSQSLVLY